MRNVAGRIPMAKNRQSSEEEKAARGVTMQAGSAERSGDERRTSKLSHSTAAALSHQMKVGYVPESRRFLAFVRCFRMNLSDL